MHAVRNAQRREQVDTRHRLLEFLDIRLSWRAAVHLREYTARVANCAATFPFSCVPPSLDF